MSTRRIRLLLEYDGTDFAGWQRQPSMRTVQGEVERALDDLDPGASGVTGAGRTDAGCHADGQVAHADVTIALPADVIRRALNARLDRDAHVKAVEEAAPGFHARFSATRRTYVYHLLHEPSPLRRRSAYAPELGAIDPAAILEAIPHLLGERDFLAVGQPSESGGTSICRVERVSFDTWAQGYRLSIVANRFLRGMVRTIVGTLLEVGRGRRSPDSLAPLIASRDRRLAGPAAPAHGLCLLRVEYPAADHVFATREGGDV